jgi:tRNA (guanine-N7-)-methyltransferase
MLKINGEVQLKTDNLPLFHYSLSSFQTFGKFKEKIVIFNLYCHPSMLSDNIKSEYETKFVAQDIKIKKLGFIKT